MHRVRPVIACAVALWARTASGGSNDPCPLGRLSDPGSVETVRGQVMQVDKVLQAKGREHAVALMLKTDAGEQVPVALGPQWVIERQGLRLRAGDRVQVTGSPIVRGKPTLLAAEVRKGDETLRLRDRHGIPVWTRGGRGKRAAGGSARRYEDA